LRKSISILAKLRVSICWLHLALLFSSFCFNSNAQVNYVLNPSLEEYWRCPDNADQIKYAKFWSPVGDTVSYLTDSSGGFCAPEYCNICAGINATTGVPTSFTFHHYPRSGNGMAQVQVFCNCPSPHSGDVTRDYLQGRLYKPLTAGKNYCVSLYVALEQGSDYAINNIGAYLDNGAIDQVNSTACALPQTQFTPQVIETAIVDNDTGWNDSLRWTKVEGSFIANGNESFITIGNFSDFTHTSYTPRTGIGPYTWYLVDDVSVIESDTKAFAWATDTLHKGYMDSILLGRNEIIPGIVWYRDGVIIDTMNAGIWCKDNDLGHYHKYVVSQTLCDVTTFDTVVVSVEAVTSGVNTLPSEKLISIYPNPSNGSFIISAQPSGNEAKIEVLNSIGQIVYETISEIHSNHLDKQINLHVPPTIYTISVQTETGVYVQRLVVNSQ